ncbi:hypothetical protein [Arhodomonas sp. AD133]|uniref:hypothetical protein n=1 Tax=Arhodomonas sp. AD133 TaxID=3415009 RepID=UPI003EBBA7E5
MSGMTIGKAARAAGVRVETVRVYGRCRLIDQPDPSLLFGAVASVRSSSCASPFVP